MAKQTQHQKKWIHVKSSVLVSILPTFAILYVLNSTILLQRVGKNGRDEEARIIITEQVRFRTRIETGKGKSGMAVEVGAAEERGEVRLFNTNDDIISYQNLWDAVHQDLSTSNTLVSGNGTPWERIYANAAIPDGWENAKCEVNHRAFPYDSDGVSVGPKLCSKHLLPPYATLDQRCVPAIEGLDSYEMLQKSNAMRFFLEPVDSSHHGNVVHDRERCCSASGVAFMGERHLAVVSYALSTLYVYQYDPEGMKVTLLDKIKNEFFEGQEGGEYTELVDFDGKDLLVCGNLRTSSFTIFRWDWMAKKLSLVQGTFPYDDLEDDQSQMTHGARFYPSAKNSDIVAATAQFKLHPESLAVRFFDWKRNETKAELLMSKTQYDGLGPQDVFFIDKHNMLVAYTPNRVTARLEEEEFCREAKTDVMYSSHLVHYRLHFDLDNQIGHVGSDKFEQLQSIQYKHSHPDSISYKDGIAVISDQYNDHVTFVAVDPTGSKNMMHIGVLTGFHMNHGVSLSQDLEHLAVANYGDNSVILSRLPSWLEEKMLKFRSPP